MITRSFDGPTHYVRGVKFTSHVVEDDFYAKPIQGRHYDTLIIDDIYTKSQHPLLTELTQRETQMPKWPKLKSKTTKPLKNNPSKVVNEVQVDPRVASDVRVQAASQVEQTKKPENTYSVEINNFHTRLVVGRGAAKLIEAAECYEEMARALRSTAGQLNRTHQ